MEVSSTFEMLSFSSEPSVEEFVHRIDQEGNRLLLTIPQLRRDSLIQGTIKCARVGRLSKRARIDTGVIVAENTEQAPLDARTTGLPLSELDDVDAVHPPSYSSPPEIDATVASLRLIAKQERDRSIIEGVPGFAKFLLVSTLPLVLAVGGFFLQQYVGGRKGQEQGNRIGRASKKGSIKIGLERESLLSLVGPPHHRRLVHEGDRPVEVWVYEPKASVFYGWQPDLVVTLKDGKVVEYEVKEYGERQYS